jgi:AraC-like DNA-binding protein
MNRFSTDRLPRQQRLPFLHDFVGRQVARWQFKPLSDDLSLDVAAFELARNTTIGRVRYSPIAGARTRELLADGRHNYMLTIHDADHEIDVENGPPIVIGAGDMLLVNEGTMSRFRLPDIRAHLVSLDCSQLVERLPGIDGQSHYHIRAGAPGVALVRDYLDLLFRNSSAVADASELTSGHLYDLVAHVLKDHVRSDKDRLRQGVGAARLEVAKRDIIIRICEPDLAISTIARKQGVTPRYLQRLFGAEGVSFSEFLRDRRLDLALAQLGDPARTGDSISSIAFDCGFSDLSHFNRSFRKRFGQAPSDVRAAAMLTQRR